eukprot:TRINITY_DN58988_c0_g1_i1.p1 TRINITY_DN58988_c0_g1~~TRINITY_DN58988_c0_g1_i1.p1  ORF type:complete len:695 (+),score=157.69 TRINITY_DN58988_c0_g1_i1:109-2193(+)
MFTTVRPVGPCHLLCLVILVAAVQGADVESPAAHLHARHKGMSRLMRYEENSQRGRLNVDGGVGAALQKAPQRGSLPMIPPEHQVCNSCCNDGDKIVPCMDVEACAASAPENPNAKYAFVLTHVGTNYDGFLPNLGSMRLQAKKHNIDIVLIITKEDATAMDKKAKKLLVANDVKVKEVDWAVPPNMLFTRPERWCGAVDLIRLQAIALEGYDAVSYYDADVQMQGDVVAPLKCASTGVLISTNGGIGEPFNVGFFALKPDPRLMQAAMNFAQMANFSDRSGWAESGFAPSGGYYVGGECGQGFFHTLFYKKSSKIGRQAMESAGLLDESEFLATQIDKCLWNYQTDYQCKWEFKCEHVRAHHKPARYAKGSNPNECQKRDMSLIEQHTKTRLALFAPEEQACRDCCNDGHKVVPCLDVDACAAHAPPGGRYAFVLAQVGGKSIEEFLPNIESMRQYAEKDRIDVLLMMTAADAALLTERHKSKLSQHGVRLVEVNWAVPPDMVFKRSENWCGLQEMIRLNAMDLEGYDAVAYYDTDVELQGNVTASLRCAHTGKFLATNGGTGEPFNSGFFAVKPDPKLMSAVREYARTALFNETTGWGNSGFSPAGGYYSGAECGTGFLHSLFFQEHSQVARRAFEEAGVGPWSSLMAAQIDKCIWNYQGSYQCKEDFDCSDVRAHKNPAKRGSDPKECLKK